MRTSRCFDRARTTERLRDRHVFNSCHPTCSFSSWRPTRSRGRSRRRPCFTAAEIEPDRGEPQSSKRSGVVGGRSCGHAARHEPLGDAIHQVPHCDIGNFCMLQGKIGYLMRPVASACRSFKRLELQLEGQAACAIDDESPADTAVRATALHRHRPQTGACVLAGGSAARADRLSRAPALLLRQADQAARGHYRAVPRQWKVVQTVQEVRLPVSEKITQPR